MNRHKLNPLRGVALSMALALLVPVALSAQPAQQFAQAQQANAQALRQYTWKMRTEVRKGGETKSVKLTLMRYGVDGTLQQTPLSSTPEPDLPTRGLRGHIAQKKKEDFMKTLASLGALAKSYGELPPDSLRQFMAGATVTPEMTVQQKLVRIEVRNVLQPGDAMTLWVDAVTRRQRRVEIQTTLDKKVVRVVSEFQELPQGPTFTARTVVDYPDKEVTLITENFDYARASR